MTYMAETGQIKTQETEIYPQSTRNPGFDQFSDMTILGAHIWAWRHAGAQGSGTLETSQKVGPLGGPDGPDNAIGAKLELLIPSIVQIMIDYKLEHNTRRYNPTVAST